MRFDVASCNEPTSVFADSREILAHRKSVEDVVVQQAMAKKVGQGAEVVQTMQAEHNVRVWIVRCEFAAEA